MNFSPTNKAQTLRAETDHTSERQADIHWLADYAKRFSAKEGAEMANMSPSGFKKIQAGDNGISFEKLTHWMRADKTLAALYAEHIGLLLPGQAETAEALTRLVNAIARKP